MISRGALVLVALLAGPVSAWSEEAARFDAARLDFFERKIRPLFVENCHTCHSADTNSRGGLRVDDRNGLLVGGERGPAIVPGDPDGSRLLRAVSHTDEDLKMPPNKQLSAEQVADLAQWIKDGAAWPAAEPTGPIGQPNPEYEALRKNHWSWQPIRDVPVPAVRDRDWPANDIDAFVLAKLEDQGLSPVADADRLTLIRRLTFDLTGLPPTPEEIDAFLGDTSSEAIARVVDRLLASPAFGERWGRHWLDVARYGESTGSSRNLPVSRTPGATATTSSRRSTTTSLTTSSSASKSPAICCRPSSQRERDEQRIATGFLALGVKDVNQRFKVRFIMDNIDEQIDTVSRSVLGLTASCARCHDHKFDPIPTADYYALAGIFHSTDSVRGPAQQDGWRRPRLLRHAGCWFGWELKTNLSSPMPKPPGGPQELKAAVAKAREKFEALRGKPEGNEPGDDGRPEAGHRAAEVEQTASRARWRFPIRWPAAARRPWVCAKANPSATPKSACAARPKSSARPCPADF